MKKLIQIVLGASILALVSCGSSKDTIIPQTEEINLDEGYTIIWYGRSKVYRYDDGEWIRSKENDYEFTVSQKRINNKWKSIKNMHRRHSDFNTMFGDRNQTMYFEVDYYDMKGDTVYANVSSTLGDGTVVSDDEFRNTVITMYPKTNAFMPYNKFRITQHYDYEEGVLTETVELLKEKDGKETPFMKNEETAYFFVRGKLNEAPTVYQK
jgi:hypothetical protein